MTLFFSSSLFLTSVLFDLNWPLAVPTNCPSEIIKIYSTARFGPGFTCWIQILRDFPWASVITLSQISLCAQLWSETGVSSDSPPLCNLYRTIIPSCLSNKQTLLPVSPQTVWAFLHAVMAPNQHRFLKADINTFTLKLLNIYNYFMSALRLIYIFLQ